MPRGGAEARGNSLATLSRILHLKSTSDELGKMLDDLTPYIQTLDPDSDEARMVRVVRRAYDKEKKVSVEWVGDFAREQTLSQSIWQQAKAENNFKLFEPHLKTMFELRRQYAEFFKPYDHVYDPLLDDYEPGMKTADVRQIFDTLRSRQVPLIEAVRQQPRIDDAFYMLHTPNRLSGILALK